MIRNKGLYEKLRLFLGVLLNELAKRYNRNLPAGAAIRIKDNKIIPDYNSFLADNWSMIENLKEFKTLEQELDRLGLTDFQIKGYTIKFIADYLRATNASLELEDDKIVKLYKDFEDYLYANELEYLCVSKICGLEHDDKIILEKHQEFKLYILPIHKEDTWETLIPYLEKLQKAGRFEDFRANFNTRQDCEVFSKYSLAILITKFPKPKGKNLSPEEVDIPSKEDRDKVERFYNALITALRLLKPGEVHLTNKVCLPLSSWTARSFIFLSSTIPPVIIRRRYELQFKETNELKSTVYFIYGEYDNLDQKLQNAIRRFNSAYEKKFPEDRLIDHVIIWDSLLYPEGRGEARRRISERMAILLGKNKNERKQIVKRIKELYEERSAIVHSNKKIDWEEAWEKAIEAEDYTRRLLKRLLKLCQIYESCDRVIEEIEEKQ